MRSPVLSLTAVTLACGAAGCSRSPAPGPAPRPLPGAYRGGKPWSFRTGKGIFSTPVIGSDGTVYVGSADSNFYAIRPGGKRRWKFGTGNIIDSAAVVRGNTVTFGSGDETLYRLTTKRRVVWRFRPTNF